MSSNRHALPTASFALLIALVGSACSNPADGKPEAAVGEPVAVPETQGEPIVFTVDPDQSFVNFVGSKVTGSHNGGFHQFDGSIELVNSDPTVSSVTLKIDTTSLWADDDRLTKHLKSPDFFQVDAYPQATFESTSIEATGDGYTVTGNLSLHGVTKSVTFPATIEVGDDSITAAAEFFVKRYDFDIVYPGKPDDLIRDEVVIQFELVAEPGGATMQVGA